MEGVEDEMGVELGPHGLRLGLGPEDRFPGRQGTAFLDPVEGFGPHHEPGEDGVEEEVVEGKRTTAMPWSCPSMAESDPPMAMANPTVPRADNAA